MIINKYKKTLGKLPKYVILAVYKDGEDGATTVFTNEVDGHGNSETAYALLCKHSFCFVYYVLLCRVF